MLRWAKKLYDFNITLKPCLNEWFASGWKFIFKIVRDINHRLFFCRHEIWSSFGSPSICPVRRSYETDLLVDHCALPKIPFCDVRNRSKLGTHGQWLIHPVETLKFTCRFLHGKLCFIVGLHQTYSRSQNNYRLNLEPWSPPKKKDLFQTKTRKFSTETRWPPPLPWRMNWPCSVRRSEAFEDLSF